MKHEVAINALQKQRIDLISKKEQFNSEIDLEINELESSIEVLSGKRVWETEPQSLYDDNNPNYLKPSYEE